MAIRVICGVHRYTLSRSTAYLRSSITTISSTKIFSTTTQGSALTLRLPIFDAVHRAKARESAADAARALHEADAARDQFFEGRLKLQHATAELAARAEVAGL